MITRVSSVIRPEGLGDLRSSGAVVDSCHQRRGRRELSGGALACTSAAAVGRGVGRSVSATMGGGVHGFPSELTSFIGRADVIRGVSACVGRAAGRYERNVRICWALLLET
jgi:hypothetical protein